MGKVVVMAAFLVGFGVTPAFAQNCGDADANGDVTVSDGVQALRAAAELSSVCDAACDVDGNGTVTVSDGVNILRKAAGLSVNEACEFTGQEANGVVNPSLSIFDGITKVPGVGGASAFTAAAAPGPPDCDNDGTVERQTGTNFAVVTFTNCEIGGAILDGQIGRVVVSDRLQLGFSDFKITRAKAGKSITFNGQLDIANETLGTRINGTLDVDSSEHGSFSLTFTRILVTADGSVRQGTLDYDLTKSTVGKIAQIHIVFDDGDQLAVTVRLRNQQVHSFLLDRDTRLLVPAV
jgi:hypothetical protein